MRRSKHHFNWSYEWWRLNCYYDFSR
jgi:hypothetical protein